MAKRVNKKFLIVLTVLVAVLGLGAFTAARVLRKKNPDRYRQLAEQAEREGDLKRARDQYRIAYAADPTNKQVLVALGDVYDRLAGEDLENLRQARIAWNAALQIDPKYAPALQRVLDTDWAQTELPGGGAPELYQHIREVAGRLAAADPANAAKAQARAHLATVRAWARGYPTQPGEVDKAVAGLAELAKRQPADAELPYAIAQVKFLRAGEIARAAGRRDDARALLDEAVKVMDDALAADGGRQQQNPAMQFRAYQIYASAAASLDPKAEQARVETLRAKSDAALKAAAALVKPDDELYVDVHANAAAQALAAGDEARARQITADLLAAKPRDQRVRLARARTIKNDPKGRDEAVRLLTEPIDESPEATRGMLALRQKLLAAETIQERVSVQMLQVGALAKPAERAQLMADMRQSLKKLESLNLLRPDDPRLLNLRGNLELLDGRLVEAADLMERAVRQMSPTSVEYFDTKFRLASIYAQPQLGQTGQARKYLDEVLEKFPQNPAALAQLARVLLQENSLDAAEARIKDLKALTPDAPEVRQLEVALMERRQPGSSAGLIAQMPEGTRAERLRKAQSLLAVKQTDAGEKLLQALIDADPKDLEAVGVLASYYAGSNQVDKATALVESALKANPGNKALAEGLKRLRTQSPEDLYNYQKERIAAIADEAQRELALYDLERQFNHRDEAGAHLARAQALKPDDVGVLARRFDWALSGGKWDDANALVEKLAAVNADEIGGLQYRFRLETARGNYAAAEDAATKMTQARPNFSQGFAALAQAQQLQQKYRDAIGNYRQALDRKPLDYDSLRGLVTCEYALNAPNEVRDVLADARKRFPNDRTFVEMELAHELEYGDPEKVVAEREKQLKENPDRPETVLALAGAYLQAVEKKYLSGPAAQNKATELRTKARDVLAQGVKKWPDDVRMAASLAEVQQWLGDATGAKATVEAFAGRPDQQGKAMAYLLRADYFSRARQPEAAEAEMREALKVADKNAAPEIRQRLVASLSQRGKTQEALAALKETGDVPPESRLFRQQVQMMVNLGKYDDALRAVEQALAKAPKSVELQNVRTAVLLEAGKLKEAEDSANQTKPDDEMTHYYLGLVQLRRQPPDTGRAIQELTLAASRNPRNYNILSGLADAYQAAGQTANAVAEQRKALSLAPVNRAVRVKLIDLLLAANQYDQVLAQANEAKAYPQLAGDWVWDRSAAVAYAKTGKFREAGQRIAQAMAVADDAAKLGLYRDQMDLLLAAKDFAGALKVTDDLLAAGKKDWWVYQYRGLAKAGTKDTAGALAEFDQALKGMDPKNDAAAAEAVARSIATTVGYQQAIERIVPWYEAAPGFRLLSAELYKAGGDYPNAASTVESLLADADRLKLPPQARAMALRSAGEIYLSDPVKPQVEKAVNAYSKLVELVPNDLLSLNNLAYLLAQEVNPPRPNDAKAFSQRAYDIGRTWSSGNGQILDTHGWVLVLTGQSQDVEEGIRVLTRAVEQQDDPSVPVLESRYHLGEAYLRRSKPDPAKASENLQIALNLIAKAKQAGQSVDPKLEAQVKSSADKAQQMIRAGAQ